MPSNQDITLAAGRVALRKIRADLRSSLGVSADEGSGSTLPDDATMVILSSATQNALYLDELLLPVRVSPPLSPSEAASEDYSFTVPLW